MCSWGEPARDGGCVDWHCRVVDEDAMVVVIDLLRHEGLLMGTSTGTVSERKMCKYITLTRDRRSQHQLRRYTLLCVKLCSTNPYMVPCYITMMIYYA